MGKIIRLIDRLMNKIGYYRPVMPEGSVVAQEEILEMFKSYGESDMFKRLLRDLSAQDIRTYFQASTDADREKIRGAWMRTNYFISLIQKSNDKRNKRGTK